VLADIQASSLRAFDADTGTVWCSAPTSATITVHFAEAVVLPSVTVLWGLEDESDESDEPPPQRHVTVTTDGGSTTATLANDRDSNTIALSSSPAQTFVLQLDAGCLGEIHLDLADRAMVYGLPASAIDAIATTIARLDRALLRRDAPALRQLARFPVGFRDTSIEHPGSYTVHMSQSNPRAYPSPRAIPYDWAPARRADPDAPRPVPQLEGGIAPGIVRVRAGGVYGQAFWELAWTRAGWRLVSLDSVPPFE
jgi:hypothetical protein